MAVTMEQPRTESRGAELTAVPDLAESRIGDRAGEKVAGAINYAADRMIAGRERLIGGAQVTRELGASALTLVGNFTGKVTDRVVDSLISAGQRLENSAIESDHRRQERTSLRAEMKEGKVGVRAKIAGLKEISAATKGMSRSEKARFGLDLTELQRDSRYKTADSNAEKGRERVEVRADERGNRLFRQAGDSTDQQMEALRGVSGTSTKERHAVDYRQREAKMVADARAAEQSIRLNSKLTRAENRETRMQARADAKARRQERRSAWMDRARTRAGEVVDSAKDRAEEAARLTTKAAKGAGKIALATVALPTIFVATAAREAYDVGSDILGGAKDAVKNATQRVGERVSSAADNHHQRVGNRAIGKAKRAANKAAKHHAKSSSEINGAEVVTR